MGLLTTNWCDIGNPDYYVLTAGVDNIPTRSEYLILIPPVNNVRVVGFGEYVDKSLWWIMEVANGDPAGTKNVVLVGGLTGQNPPQIILPGTFTSLTIPPGYTQRITYAPGIGWIPLMQASTLA